MREGFARGRLAGWPTPTGILRPSYSQVRRRASTRRNHCCPKLLRTAYHSNVDFCKQLKGQSFQGPNRALASQPMHCPPIGPYRANHYGPDALYCLRNRSKLSILSISCEESRLKTRAFPHLWRDDTCRMRPDPVCRDPDGRGAVRGSILPARVKSIAPSGVPS